MTAGGIKADLRIWMAVLRVFVESVAGKKKYVHICVPVYVYIYTYICLYIHRYIYGYIDVQGIMVDLRIWMAVPRGFVESVSGKNIYMYTYMYICVFT